MDKIAKVYLINIGGNMKSIKAFSKKQISKELDISLYQVNYDCQVFSLEEWKDGNNNIDIENNNIDIDLIDLDNTQNKEFNLDFKEALKRCIDGNKIQNIEYPSDYFLIFNGRGFEDSSSCELDTYDFCNLENKWRAF